MRLLTTALHSCATSCANVLAAALLVVLLAAAVAAQGTTDGATPSGLTPGSPAGSYALSDFDTVNLYNGSLNFRLPLLNVGGRGGAGYPIKLHVEKKWSVYKHFEPGAGTFYYADAGWWSEEGSGWRIFSAGKVDIRSAWREQPRGYPVETLTRVTFTAPEGTEYELRDQMTNGQPISPPQPGGFNRGRVFVTTDGTAATFYCDWDIRDDPYFGQGGYDDRPDGYLMLKDGTRYRVEDGKIAWMRDRNGNMVSFGYDPSRRVTSVSDSLGRQVTITYPEYGGAYTEIGFKGFGGAQRTIRIGQATLGSAGTLRSGFSPMTVAQLFPELHGGGGSTTVVTYVELPDGRRYDLQYNPYGELARVVLPTGGAIEYDHAAGLTGGAASGVFQIGNDKYIYRRVIERRVYPDGGSGSAYASKMTYSRPETNTTNDGHVIEEQCTPSGSLGVCGTGTARLGHSRHYYHGSPRASFGQNPVQYGAYKDGREYKTEVYETDAATLLRRVEQTFAQRAPVGWWGGDPDLAPPNDVRTTETVTTVADANLVSKQTFAYDRYNNTTDVYDYDYGTGAPGGLLRRTHTDYVTTNTVGGVTYDYACDPATTCSNASINANVIHLRALTGQQWVSSDAAGSNKVSLTTYAYDQAGLTDRAGITGLCTTYSGGTCSSSNSTAYVTRGNPTGVTRYANAAAWTGPLTTTSAYDIAGNVVSKTDPKGYTTQTAYGDSFCNGSACGGTYTPNTYAFASSTTSPVPDVSTAYGYPAGTFGSAYSFATSTVYDFYTGLSYSTTDANNKTMTVEYADALNRPTAQIRPDGSRTDVEYYDAVGNLYVRVLADLDVSRRTETRQYFDGFGRPYRSLTYENQDTSKPWITTEAQYDALGRVVKQSLPFRSTGGATPLTPTQWSSTRRAETEYDALGRVKKTTTLPDGAAVTTSYLGDATTVTDQASRSRKSVTDALGRLKQVYEDPSGLNYLTSYTYDANGNLGTVTQDTQTRTFVYDSLGRLTSSTAPEGGTTGYTYDANSNLETRTDARGVTATYMYDRLNRNIITTYSGGGTTTPAARRYYDGATNGKGRLYWTEAAGIVAAVFDAYDAGGRPTQFHQVYWTGAPYWGTPFYVSRTYNKAGAAATQTYPSGRTVTYNYDAAGRPGDYNGQAAMAGSLGDGVTRTYASEVRYHEMGGMEQERFGTDTPVYNKSLYNGRNQLAEIRVSTHSILSPGQETNWNRGAIINHYSNSGWGASGGGADNNGNLRKQEVYIPNDDQISGYFNVVQYYGYDALNRLVSVEDKPWNGSPDFYQAYTYDRWGNRTVNAGGTWNAPAPQFTASAATNRLAPPAGYTMSYDAAGNLTYDNYTGAGTRAYDAENRMTSAQDFYGQTSTYKYDADGKRVSRRVAAGAEVWQVYGIDGELVAEYAAGASPTTPQKEYGYRGGELLVQATAPVSTGAGLTASYFDNMNFTNLKLVRTDATVNFDWGGGTPHPTVGVDTFTARWEGKVEPLYTQTYTFYTVSDDGVRLWVNGQLVIDKWFDQGPTEWSGQIALTAGQRYDIRMEFYENGGGATAKLLWSSASQAKGVIPQSQLYPATASNQQADFEWMVYDQLGTPRMVIDKTGSLARVKRHDYLPFGEEVGADLTWRTTGRGYAGDDVRQKFTGYERDAETGLDYAQARYFASAQGRFAGVDPILIGEKRLADPQLLNLYAYARNNPLKYTDPAGMDVALEGAQTADAIDSLNNRSGAKFKVANVGNMVRIVDNKGNPLGKAALEALGKTLSGGEKELFKAITDDKTHATIDTGNGQPNDKVLFGRNDKQAGLGPAGRNTLDMSEMKLLDAPENKDHGGLTSGDAIAHEILEAYGTASGMSYDDAHAYAGRNFGAFGMPSEKHQGVIGEPDSSGYHHNGLAYFPVYKPDGKVGMMGALVRFTQGIKLGVTKTPPTFNVTRVGIAQPPR
jgi:RHS repeat-associated protein